MAGICAARQAAALGKSPRILLLDGAKKLGAKILVAGGGRCNVTHDQVDETAYAGSSRNAIKKVLRRFDVPQTVAFFRDLGVDLKRESTGKLFPTTDDSQTVLDALLNATQSAGVEMRHPCRVDGVSRDEATGTFRVRGAWGEVSARRVILATGGKSLPKSGSDGHGYEIARRVGHHPTERIFPALVPLLLPRDHFLCALSGLTLPASIELWSGSGKRLVGFTDSTLCTHFGLSGPSVLDFSRYYLDAHADDPNTHVTINWLPTLPTEQVEADLLTAGQKTATRVTLLRWGEGKLPERLLRALCAEVGIEPGMALAQLTREGRRALARALTRLPLPIIGDRGFTYAEVTAGGIPLSELRLETLESRLCPGLYLCGEICDVDGRIGGYNFQWAWASGYVAGTAAVNANAVNSPAQDSPQTPL